MVQYSYSVSHPESTPLMAEPSLLERAQGSSEVGEDAIRERILEAATAEFRDFGLRRTTVDAVARRTGVGRMTLYRRFAGKDELVEAVILSELRAFMTELDAAMSERDPIAEQLVEGLVFTVEHAREHALLGRLLDTEPEAALPYLTLDGGTLIEAAIAFTAERIRRSPGAKGTSAAGVANAAEACTRIAQSLILTPGERGPRALRLFARQVIPPLLDSARG